MGANILIVEDEEPLTTLLRYNLEAEGYEVDAVARGDEADTRLREAVPDLIVLDWMLPGLSGIELCRRLRARPQTQSLPIIMLTARGEESERVRGLATGADDYIVKPFSVPELMARFAAQAPSGSRPYLPSATWNSIARKNAYRVQAGRLISDRRNSACSNFSWNVQVGSLAGSNCSTGCGAATSISTSARWTSMSAACARRLTAVRAPIRSAPCAAPATRSTIGSAKQAEPGR
jgi:CheY-like chemotaxis protein